MKHLSAQVGSPKEIAVEQFAWWPVRTVSGKLVWLRHYVEVRCFYDDMGRPPITKLSWNRAYTTHEYLLYTLKRVNK